MGHPSFSISFFRRSRDRGRLGPRPGAEHGDGVPEHLHHPDQIARDHAAEYATGILVYGACFTIFVIVMSVYCVCLYKGMKGKYDVNVALGGEPKSVLKFRNPLNKSQQETESLESRAVSKDSQDSRLTAEADKSPRRSSLLLPGGFPSSRRSSRSGRSSRRHSECLVESGDGSDSDESVMISMN